MVVYCPSARAAVKERTLGRCASRRENAETGWALQARQVPKIETGYQRRTSCVTVAPLPLSHFRHLTTPIIVTLLPWVNTSVPTLWVNNIRRNCRGFLSSRTAGRHAKESCTATPVRLCALFCLAIVAITKAMTPERPLIEISPPKRVSDDGNSRRSTTRGATKFALSSLHSSQRPRVAKVEQQLR
jgi:hypothetical protein